MISKVVPVLLTSLYLTAPAAAQEATLDWKMHDVGKVRQLVTNMGTLWTGLTNYPGLLYAEYPPNSFQEHVAEGGIKVGAIVNGDTLVSITNFNNGHQNYEFFPTSQPDDTIYVARKGETYDDIPFWPNYVGVSDQDYVMRYSDYNVTNISDHVPMYVDVLQVSYAWSSPPLDEVIIYRYKVVPTRYALDDAFVGFQLQGRVGRSGVGVSGELLNDDYSTFYPDQNLAVIDDKPGGADGNATAPIGVKVFPPAGFEQKSMIWYTHHHQLPTSDELTYADQMASGEVMQSQDIGGQAIVALSYGPFDVAVGDTLEFTVAEVLGVGLEGVLRNAQRLEVIYQQDFKVPSAPPSPPLRVMTRNESVQLSWEPGPGEDDPVEFHDPYRGDGVEMPFEGFRLYKSTVSETGPWTLLAEYDVQGNGIGYDTGVQYRYEDTGLLNNFEYYYAVTSYARDDEVLDFRLLESGINTNATRVVPGTEPPETVGQVAVVPNPYRGDAGYQSYNPAWEKPPGTRERWLEQDRRIQFINLPPRCEIQIYTVAGDPVQTLRHESAAQGFEDWNLTSRVGQAISSGVYLFTVEDLETGAVQVGTFAVIK